MKKPIVAIIGRPNVGKSRLFNKFLGKRVAIVEDVPGVTRDRHYADCEYQGRSFTLVDTGGLDPTSKTGIIRQIRAQTERAIEEADLLILLFDGREGVTPLDQEIVSLLRPLRKPIFYAVNKIDTPKSESWAADFYNLGIKEFYSISAEHGLGVDELMEQLLPFLPKAVEDEAEQTEIPKIAVVGRPNVGKSTLVNSLLGEERVLTDATPGTTRDAIDTLIEHQDKQYLFIDTAGVRRRGKIERGVERYSMARALQAIERCDLAVVLLDASEGIVEQDTKIIGHVLQGNKGCIILVNKWDLQRDNIKAQDKILAGLKRRLGFISFAPLHGISALKGEGLDKIFNLIDQVMEGYTRRVKTGELNRWFRDLLETNPPPSQKGRRIKLNYITQAAIKPPTFVIFANNPTGVADSYKRFLENRVHADFDLTMTPVRLLFREKSGRHKEEEKKPSKKKR
jgi:GTP-binding protein